MIQEDEVITQDGGPGDGAATDARGKAEKKRDKDTGKQGGEPFSNVNNNGEKGCWNCKANDNWKYQ